MMSQNGIGNSVGSGPSALALDPATTYKITALVVDDDAVTGMIHRRLLDSLGVKNEVVRNGKEAINVHRSGNPFDLILMDMEMPVMNGIEVSK